MTGPSRRHALGAAAAAGVVGIAGAITARRTAAASRERRARADRGRPVSLRGADGGARNVRIHGADGDPTLVLVHCWTGTQELWHRQVESLAGELRIVTYDHRGHGLSDDAQDRDYSLEALAADLQLVLEATVPEGERPMLAGHSMGAMTIVAWAEAHRGSVSDRVRGTALMSTGLDQLMAETQLVRPLPGPFGTVQGRIADSVLEIPASIQGIPLPIVKAAAGYAALGPGARDEDVELTALMALDCRTRARAGCGHAMSRMSLLDKLDALDVPSIVISGERDLMTPIAHAERIETALPRSLGLRVDPSAGHMTPLESPELVNEALREVAQATANDAADTSLAA